MNDIEQKFGKNAFFSTVYARYKSELQNYVCRNWQKSQDEALDLIHDAYIRLMSVADPEKITEVRGFLYKTLKNILLDTVRRQGVMGEHQDEFVGLTSAENSLSPELHVVAMQQIDMVRNVVEKMPSKMRRAFILRKYHHLSYDDISEDMGLSKDAVKKHVYRALEACENCLKDRVQG